MGTYFSVGESGELSFTTGIAGEDLRPAGKWEKGDCEKRAHFSPISSTTSRHRPLQPTSRVLCPPFPHFPPFSPLLQTPKSGFSELVSLVAVMPASAATTGHNPQEGDAAWGLYARGRAAAELWLGPGLRLRLRLPRALRLVLRPRVRLGLPHVQCMLSAGLIGDVAAAEAPLISTEQRR